MASVVEGKQCDLLAALAASTDFDLKTNWHHSVWKKARSVLEVMAFIS